MIITVDRIEGDYAVVEKEDMSTVSVPLSFLPGCREGAVYEILEKKGIEDTRKTQMQSLFDSLKKK